jgi:biopolymer transport protein ExbD
MPLSAHLPDPEPLNMTPMIDVVFNLLVFFLLSASFYAEERELELSVPAVGSTSAIVSGPQDIVVNVSKDCRVTINSQLHDAVSLESFLKSAVKNYPGQGVAIRGDKEARYQWIADVLAICKRAGVRRLDVVVQESP